jgi:threonylcarbamoyladenosine tRNA methylthiotransferase MtaB
MRRRYRREVFEERVNKIRNLIPYAGIGADVIVGFPGESDSDFEDTYNFIEGLPLTYLHVFTFSVRPGTAAALMAGKVRSDVSESRSKRLIRLSAGKHREFLEKSAGTEAMVLFEHSKRAGLITGYTGSYIRVVHGWDSSLAGQIRKVKLISPVNDDQMNIELIV